MKKINIQIENCYGIKKLDCSFDFTRKRTYSVYAPNGFMKTSFAKTFMDLSKKEDSKDLIFSDRITKRLITDENNDPIQHESVFVIEPYNEAYKSSKVSTLLVNPELKDKYDSILRIIDEKKDALLKELKTVSGLKSNIEELLSEAFTYSSKEFFKSISRVKSEVHEKGEPEFAGILYNEIFNEKVVSFLETKDFKEKLKDYIEQYDKLIADSTYFKKGVFNHNNASVIAKNLKDNGFFKAKHFVVFNSGTERKEITTEKELEDIIEQEKNTILNDPNLVKAFEEIDSKLKSNKELRDFREYLLEHLSILPELSNLNSFKQKLWVSYLKEKILQYNELETEYSKGKAEIEEILEKAKREETEWRNVIYIFNKRFSVPFIISVENQEDVILKSQSPNFKFKFKDDDPSQSISIAENDLLRVLSNGEKRALYILNIIFEVEARKYNNQTTLFVVDDIADSFDYKNKYAIIEYLKDIGDNPIFRQIILTHNFDFHRTVSSRLDMGRENKLNTLKTTNGITLIQEKYQKNPFTHWKDNLATNTSMLIASIPFVRNIAEYSGDDNVFERLTSLLHIKSDSSTFKISELETIHKSVLKDKSTLTLPDPNKNVMDLIFEVAEVIYNDQSDIMELESKIVMAIAIRLKAEIFMIREINDSAFCGAITENQTFKLFSKYKELNPQKDNEIRILDQVNLMTPENIHINSFMYEPILDMSNVNLKGLYNEIKTLT